MEREYGLRFSRGLQWLFAALEAHEPHLPFSVPLCSRLGFQLAEAEACLQSIEEVIRYVHELACGTIAKQAKLLHLLVLTGKASLEKRTIEACG